MRGIAYSKLGDGDRADADFRKVSELSPRAAEAHMNRGVDFMRQGDLERSIEALKHATTVNPKLATAFSNLGTAYQKKGDLDAAIESYNHAIKLRSKYPIAFSNRAYSYFLKGEHDRAIVDATHAIKLDAGLAIAHTNLGHALAGKGDAIMAARSYRRALSLSPDQEVEEETLKALEKLGVRADDEDDERLMKLLRVIVEGQLYLAGILTIFVAEVAFLLWGLWSRRPIISLVAVFVTVPLIRSTVSAISACFFRIPAPEGMPLGRSEGRALYDVVEEIRRAVDAPPIDSITVTSGFNASAAAHWPPWRIRRRRTLVVGLPVLTTLSVAELRAVIAHELAHFSGAYDPFAAWVYRTRRSWFAIRASLNRRLATPLYVLWLIRWYVPRLNVASAEVARRHELVADRIAAKVAGSRAAADALVVFESGARFAEDIHWPKIQMSHETVPEPPRPYSQMLTWNARITSTDGLDALFANETKPDDTHPSLRERFAHLEEAVRVPPLASHSAGEEILGGALATLAGRLDQEWLTRYESAWHQHRTEYLDQRATLDRLAAVETPTADELFKRAEILELFERYGRGAADLSVSRGTGSPSREPGGRSPAARSQGLGGPRLDRGLNGSRRRSGAGRLQDSRGVLTEKPIRRSRLESVNGAPSGTPPAHVSRSMGRRIEGVRVPEGFVPKREERNPSRDA